MLSFLHFPQAYPPPPLSLLPSLSATFSLSLSLSLSVSLANTTDTSCPPSYFLGHLGHSTVFFCAALCNQKREGGRDFFSDHYCSLRSSTTVPPPQGVLRKGTRRTGQCVRGKASCRGRKGRMKLRVRSLSLVPLIMEAVPI